MNTGGKIVNVQWDFDFRDGIFLRDAGLPTLPEGEKKRARAGSRVT